MKKCKKFGRRARAQKFLPSKTYQNMGFLRLFDLNYILKIFFDFLTIFFIISDPEYPQKTPFHDP